MTEDDWGFHKVTPEQLSKIRMEKHPKRTQIIFVNRREYFKPPGDTMKRYLEYLRRYKEYPTRRERYALDGSHYKSMYFHKITNNGKALSVLRGATERSRKMPVYFVDETGRPDCDILIEICNTRINHGVW